MAAKDLGTKHLCFKCGTKFYDLKKPQAVCPKCGADQKDAVAKPEGRRSRLSAVPKIVDPIDVPEKESAEDEAEEAEEEESDEEP